MSIGKMESKSIRNEANYFFKVTFTNRVNVKGTLAFDLCFKTLPKVNLLENTCKFSHFDVLCIFF